MELTFECPKCESVSRVKDIELVSQVPCPCGFERELNKISIQNGKIKACPWCSTEDLYIQKDFPHSLGMFIIVFGFLLSTGFYYYYMPVAALAVLLATAALDLLLYYIVPDVTICYRCLCQFRGAGVNPEGRFAPFDLAIGERYRQERLRIEELRARQLSKTTGSIPPPSINS